MPISDIVRAGVSGLLNRRENEFKNLTTATQRVGSLGRTATDIVGDVATTATNKNADVQKLVGHATDVLAGKPDAVAYAVSPKGQIDMEAQTEAFDLEAQANKTVMKLVVAAGKTIDSRTALANAQTKTAEKAATGAAKVVESGAKAAIAANVATQKAQMRLSMFTA